jgi:hypothetical protein
MSYDLYFTGQRISKAEFIDYFQNRDRYELENDRASYFNQDTGVYFYFCYEDEGANLEEDDIPCFTSFNLNYCRPHFFGLEAEPEITAFAAKFGSSINDPQGADDGEYLPEDFLRIWNTANKWSYSTILDSKQSPEVIYTRSTEELEAIWRWNYSRDRIYDDLGIDLFVPRIMFALVDGNLKTMCIWPDAIATLIPYTDIVYIGRKELGSDDCIVDRSALDGILPDFDSSFPVPARNPAIESLPESIRSFVRDLQPFQGEISIVSPDDVLNAEYVSDYLSRRGQSEN